MDETKSSALDLIKRIDNYLVMGGMFNPEEMEHHKVRDLLLDTRNELKEIHELLRKQQVIVRRIYAEQLPDTWFVCGELGEKDSNGLPKYIEVCPAYGADWSQIYERTERTIGGMGS